MKLSAAEAAAAAAATAVAVGAAVMACCLALREEFDAETPGMAWTESQVTRAKARGISQIRPIVIVVTVRFVLVKGASWQGDEMRWMRMVQMTSGRVSGGVVVDLAAEAQDRGIWRLGRLLSFFWQPGIAVMGRMAREVPG